MARFLLHGHILLTSQTYVLTKPAPQTDLPPHLEHGESLLDYGSQLVSDTDFGYSTVRDAIVHVNSTRRKREEENGHDYQHRVSH